MTLGGPKRFLLKNREKKFHISGVARKLENVSCVNETFDIWSHALHTFCRNRAKKNSFTTLNLLFLLLKTMFDSISRIILFSTWLYVVNDGQFSSTKTVIAYYSTFSVLFIFNSIFNKQQDFTIARTWIGKIEIDSRYLINLLISF